MRHLPSTFTLAAFFCLTWLRVSGHASTQTCVIHRFVGCHSRLFLVRLTCLWSDVRILLHLCTASELNLSLQHNKQDVNDSINEPALNVHKSVYDLPRVSVSFAPLALVFALRQRLPPNDDATAPVALPRF